MHSLFTGESVFRKKRISKRISIDFLILPYSFRWYEPKSRSSFDGQRTSRPVFEKFLLGKFRIFKFGINRNAISRWKIGKMRKGLKNIISLYIRGNVERVNIQLVSLPKTRWWANIISGQLNVATSQNDAITSTRPRRDKNSRYPRMISKQGGRVVPRGRL